MPTRLSNATKQARRERDAAESMRNDAVDNARNAMNVVATARAERDSAREERDATQKRFESITSLAVSQRGHIRRLFNSIFHLNLELARKAGYIDRVREEDAGGPVVEPVEGVDVDTARDALAGARSEKMVASVIDGMDDDVLDQVLGRDLDADYVRG